eukprot:363362-Chlamydomonas_euryale.AAC.1
MLAEGSWTGRSVSRSRIGACKDAARAGPQPRRMLPAQARQHALCLALYGCSWLDVQLRFGQHVDAHSCMYTRSPRSRRSKRPILHWQPATRAYIMLS